MKMMRSTWLFVFLCAFAMLPAYAAETSTNAICTGDYHVQRNGVEVFCADCVDPRGETINYTGTCAAPDIYRLTRAPVNYPPATTVRNADVQEFSAIWGHASYNDAELQWPGYRTSNARWMAPVRSCTAARFMVPLTTPLSAQGYFKGISNYGGPNLLFSVSTLPCDFTNAVVMLQNDGTPWYWRLQNGSAFYHVLPRGVNLYVNTKFQDPAQSGAVHVLHSWNP